MAKVIGFDPKAQKQFTCYYCYAIVEYNIVEEKPNGNTDEGVPLLGLYCPNCGKWHRTNP